LNVTGSTGVARFFIQNGFTINQPSCWNTANGTCAVVNRVNEIQVQRPDELTLQIYQGDFTSQGGSQLSAGVYVDKGNIIFNNGTNSSFVGEAIGKNISAQNNPGTSYGYIASEFAIVPNVGPVITSPLPQNWINNPRPTVTAQISDSDGIDTSKTVLQINGVTMGGVQTSSSSINWTATSDLASGDNNVKLTIFDSKGASTTKEWIFKIDATPPLVSELSPGSVTATSVTISAKLADSLSGIDDAKTQLWLDGVDITASASRNQGQISYVSQQSPGNHIVKLIFADIAGNTGEANWSYSVISTGPGVRNLSMIDGSKIAADTVPHLKAEFVDGGAGIDLAKTTLLLDGQNINALANLTVAGFDYTPSQLLTEGGHVLKITLVDKLGNISIQVINFISSSPPIIAGQQPIGPSSGNSVSTISASYTDVGSGIDVSKILLWIDQVDVSSKATTTATGTTYTTAEPLAVGSHKVKLQVVDKAGNVTISEWEFTNIVPPVISVVGPKDVVLPAGSKPTISANFADANSVIDTSSIRLIINGQDVTAQSLITATNITYTPPMALAEGPYTIYLEVSNKANGSAQAVWGFEVDTLTTYNLTIVSPFANAISPLPLIDVIATANANKTYQLA
jgi:hypothetical protein